MSNDEKEARQSSRTIEIIILHDREGTYFTQPFMMPADIEALTLSYRYERYQETKVDLPAGEFTHRTQINIIDLGLIAPDGHQVGVSGSNKTEIHISSTSATPGYLPCDLLPGEWQILVGAYLVAPEGVKVIYELTFTHKHLRLLKGDLHSHTWASDGVQTAEALVLRAQQNGLEFLAITDHNQPISAEALPKVPGITLIPSFEWTHYRGHANFLGCSQPYDGSFYANTPAEVRARFDSAHADGATIVLNHPFDEECPWLFGFDELPFDLIEIWNAPMRESNLKAVALWQSLLAAGKKVPACGGSDFHRDTPFLFIGGPTTCVYTMSNSPSDILAALRQGHAYIVFEAPGPSLELTAGEAILGDSVAWTEVKGLRIKLSGLLAGDVVRVVTDSKTETLLQVPANGDCELTYAMPEPGFARVELLRAFMPGLPMLPALLSNPIYFDV
jgi:hypothetical protein